MSKAPERPLTRQSETEIQSWRRGDTIVKVERWALFLTYVSPGVHDKRTCKRLSV
jgi:hypothetical protein